MDEGIKSSTEAILLSVGNYGDPQNLVSPEDFKDIVLGVLQNGMKDIHLTTTEPNNLSSCSIDMYKCSDFMLLSCLSAMEALFQSVSEENVCTLIASTKAYSPNSVHDTPTKTSPHHQEHSESVQSSQIWYRNTANQLSASNVAELLVKYLVSGNKITAFLARKTLLSGLGSQHIETSQLLSLLKQELNAGHHICVPLIEILRDMMSQKRFKDRQIHCKTFDLLKEINLENLVETQFKENQSSYFYTGGLLEYLSLIRKVIKFSIHQFDTNAFQDFSYITKIVNKILLPLIDCFFTAAKTENVYFICLESIKAINTLLDIRFIEAKSVFQEIIFNICTSLQTKVLSYIQIARKSNLFSGFNFVGTILSSKDKTSISVSALTRQMVLLALKTYCATLKGDCSYTAVMDDLKCLWDEVGCAINGTGGQDTQDWLPVVFADQDDQWIIALFCLLIIHKEIKKKQNNSQKCVTVNTKTTDSYECSSNLQHTVCPHRLFLQLASFVDYDHLVLVDFLISPETPFLPYFTQYLHVMSKDWQDFVLVCLKEDTDVKLGQSGSEKCKPLKHLLREQSSFEAAESVKTFPAAETSSHYFLRTSQEASYSDNLLPLWCTRNSVLCSGSVQKEVAASHVDAHPTEILKDQTVSSNDAHQTEILKDQTVSSNDAHQTEILKDQTVSSNDAHPKEILKDQTVSSNDAHQAEILKDQTVSSNDAHPTEILKDQTVSSNDAHQTEILKDQTVSSNDAHPTEILKDQTVSSNDAHQTEILKDQTVSSNDAHPTEIPKDQTVSSNDAHPTEIPKDQTVSSNDAHPTEIPKDQTVSSNDANPKETLKDQTVSSNDAHPTEIPKDQTVSSNDAHPTEILKDQTVSSIDVPTSVIRTVQHLSQNQSYLSEILKDPLQCSVATSSNDVFSVTLSKDLLQPSTSVSYNLLLNSAPTSRTIVSSTTLSSDHFRNSSTPFRDERNNSSLNQCSKKQEHSISPSCACEDVVSDEPCGGRSLALVAYSDSDSEDDTETNLDLQATKQTMKRCLSSDSDSDIECSGETQNMKTRNLDLQATKQTMKRCLSSDSDSDIECSGETQNMKTRNLDLQATKQTMKRCLSRDSDKSSFSLHRSDCNDVCTSLFYESTLGDITDENKCSKNVDNILGMLIRLRLHIERLDHSSLFPYNPKPLVTLLEACEELYETPIGS